MRPCNCLRVLEVAVEAALRAPSSLPAVAAAAVEHQLRPSLQHEEGEEAAAVAAAVVEHQLRPSLQHEEGEEAAAVAAAAAEHQLRPSLQHEEGEEAAAAAAAVEHLSLREVEEEEGEEAAAVAAAAVEHQLRPSLQHEEGEEAAAAAAVEHLSLREVEEEEAAAAAAAEQEAVVGSAWLPFAGSSQPSVVPHRATSEVEVVVAVAGGGRKAIRQQAPLKCSWGDDLGLSVCRWLSCWGGLTRRSRCDHANTR
jgi:hypothetical protein